MMPGWPDERDGISGIAVEDLVYGDGCRSGGESCDFIGFWADGSIQIELRHPLLAQASNLLDQPGVVAPHNVFIKDRSRRQMLKAFPKLLVLLKRGDYNFQSVGIFWMVTGLVLKECGVIDKDSGHVRIIDEGAGMMN